MAYATGRIQKRIYKDFENNTDAELSDNISAPRKSRGWCWGMAAGIGSMLLGIVLALMPNAFVDFLVYVLSALLIIGALQQYVSLFMTSKITHINFAYWIMPTLLLLAGIVAVAYPAAIASSPLFFIGWCMIVYGIVECINGIKAYAGNRKAANTITRQAASNGKPDFSDAETVDYEEIEK